MGIKKNMVALGVRVKLNSNFIEKCLGDKFLIEQEEIIFISEGHVYNDRKGEYVMIRGGSLMNSGYAYLDQLDLEFQIPETPHQHVKPHQHVLKCIEHELINLEDRCQIKVVNDGKKVSIWNGDKYCGTHLYK